MQLIFDLAKSGKIRPSYKNMKFDCCDGVIGRSSEADYQLNDVDNYISGKHVYIEYKYEQYYLRDESTNGTFLKHPYKKLSKGIPHQINASDVYIIGDHELQARFNDNEYTDDYIIGSFSNEPEPLEAIKELIPDDDFLYEDVRDALNSVSNDTTEIKEDVLELLDGTKMASKLLDMHAEEPNELQEIEQELYSQYINVPTAVRETKKKSYSPTLNQNLGDSIRILEEKLGLEIIALENKERNLLMNEIADLLITSMEGLKNTLHINEKIKQDLHILSPIAQEENDLLRLGNSALRFLQDERMQGKERQVNLPSAVSRAFAGIDTHSIALHGASKNLLNTALTQVSPKSLEKKFDASGELRSWMPRSCLLWKAYNKMFEQFQDDPNFGIELLSPHFKNEYEKVAFSVKLASSDSHY